MGAQPSMDPSQSKVVNVALCLEELRLLNTDWPIIVLVSETQAGKSSFINLIAKKQQEVSESIDSCTDRITLLEATINGQPVVIIDTPGIDNTRPGVTGSDVLEMIAECLAAIGRRKRWVTGVLYLHRITDPRFGPTAARIANTLRKLCGESAMNRVMLCTTMWDLPTSDDSKRRHTQLCNSPALRGMIANGARTETHSNRWGNARENAERILSDLIKDLKPGPLAIQIEMIDYGKTVVQTSAAQELLNSPLRERRVVVDERERKEARVPDLWGPSFSEKERRLLKTGWPIIFVFGQSGAGKSTFVNLITKEQQKVGRSVHSCTEEVKFLEATYHSKPVVLIDTPGIDDTRSGVTEADVLETIAKRLEAAGRADKWVTGILYLHRIIDPRFTPAATRITMVLEKLCGDTAMKRVMLCTTMWDMPELEESQERHTQLCETTALKVLIDSGARTASHSSRWENAQANAEKILDDLINGAQAEQLAIQKEMIEEGRTVAQTEAGRLVIDHIESRRAKVKNEIRELRQRMKAERRTDKGKLTEAMAVQEATMQELKRQERQLSAEADNGCIIC